MGIAIDARQVVRPDIGRVSGVHQYTSQIIEAMQKVSDDDLILFGDDAGALRGVPFVGNHLALPHAIHKEQVDVFFSPTGLLPLGLSVPSVVFLHDLFILKHPEWFPDTALQQVFTLRLVLPKTVVRARRILVPSVSVERDLIEAFPEARGKVEVIAEGVAPHDRSDYPLTPELREDFQIPGRYLVSVATVEPRKNLLTALKAFEAILTARPALAKELQFVIAGNRGWGFEPVLAAMEDLNQRWRHFAPSVVRYVGSVSDEQKWALYSNADLYLCTSFAEGFGLPPFEAMAVGTPVVTTAVGAIIDVAKDAVAIVKEEDVEGIKRTILDLLDHPDHRSSLGQKGFDCVKSLTWETAARRTLAVLHAAAQQ